MRVDDVQLKAYVKLKKQRKWNKETIPAGTRLQIIEVAKNDPSYFIARICGDNKALRLNASEVDRA